MRRKMQAIWCATFGAVLAVCALLTAPPAMAQTLTSRNAQADCAASKCEVSFSFTAAVRLERVACVFDMRAPAAKTPRLIRAVLRRVTTSSGAEAARQDLPFTHTYDNGARQIFVVATNPLFNLATTETAEINAVATNDTNSIKVECYAAGFPQ